jgi:putative intracellular protease/amidase/YHS domain-containing protein
MNRRELLRHSATLGAAAAFSADSLAVLGAENAGADHGASHALPLANRLTPPAHGSTTVAFLISEGAVMIDFAGPWEVFQDVNLPGRSDAAFSLYTVAETTQPIRASGGMRITPDYTIANAPVPKVIVIPAQSPASDKVRDWIRNATKTTDVTMSVCNGAFVLASTGLLSGKAATAYHGSFIDLQKAYPDIQVKRGVRFVEVGNLASSGGLSSGIDLALRVVERYYGREVARKTAFTMEYQGEGWMNPDSNAVYARPPVQTRDNPVCPVCWMDVDHSIKSDYKGKVYYFCSQAHKQSFDKFPEEFVES